MAKGRAAARHVVLIAIALAVVISSSVSSAQGGANHRFVDATRRAHLERPPTGTWGSLWTDYDGDGWADLFVGRHGAKPYLWANEKGRYEPRWPDFVSPRGYDPIDGDLWVDRHNCAWGEANGDGRPDLYCAVGANVGTGVGPNQLFIQRERGFAERADDFALGDIYGRGRSVNWLDYDGDNDLDLFVGNWARAGHPSALFRNDRGSFTRARAGIEHQLRTISSSWADWDRDGDPDLLVMQYTAPTIAYENTGGHFRIVSIPGITDGHWHSAAWDDFDADGWIDVQLVNDEATVILKNDRGRFRPIHSFGLLEGRTSAWIDVDNDGDLDSFVVAGAPGTIASRRPVNYADVLLLNEESDFRALSDRVISGPRRGSGDGAAVADSDRDGRLDLLVTNGYFEYDQWLGPIRLLRNMTEAGNWLAVDLEGPRWNPWGIGARVTLTTEDDTYHRPITDRVVFRSQSELGYLHFGIGEALTGRVHVQWPDGTEDCTVVLAGNSSQLRHGAHPCPSLP